MAITKQIYPKTFQLLCDWLEKEMSKKLPQNVPQSVLSNVMKPETLANMAISDNSNILFQFFDNYNMYPSVYKVEMGWKWRCEGGIPVEGNAAGRKEAESKVFEECAKKLENL